MDIAGASIYTHVPENDLDEAWIQISDTVRLDFKPGRASLLVSLETIAKLRRALDDMEAGLRVIRVAR